MSFDDIKRIVIAGVGMIGGSVGLALKKAGFRGRIVGLGRRWSSLKIAIDMGTVDSGEMDYEEAMKDTDLLLISTPVDVISSIAREAVKYAKKGCIITDAGSTKALLAAEIEKIIPENIYFVGVHPMAGSHRTGAVAADANLFNGAKCIITPTEYTNPDALKIVSELWHKIGAHLELMSPQEHDYLVGAASHLPHVVASALIQVVSATENKRGKAIDFGAKGFADTTRIAGADPKIWKGILMQNAGVVSSMLEKMERELADIRKFLEDRDEKLIEEKLEIAKDLRDSLK